MRLIAFYLPQYHPIPENDLWWGKGFTEWTNVAKAKPLFPGHQQPKLPGELGFYDLRVAEVRQAQADLAKESGIEGFCYWHYWFAGKKLLERPLEEVLKSGKPEFPFCLAWANQTWSGIWHGSPDKVLIEQTYPGAQDHIDHFNYLKPFFMDHRYIRIDGKLVFIVYKISDLPDPKKFANLWNRLAEESGLPGFFFIFFRTDKAEKELLGFDGEIINHFNIALEYSRCCQDKENTNSLGFLGLLRKKLGITSKKDLPVRFKYSDFIHAPFPSMEDDCQFISIIPNWDNTPRTGKNGIVLLGSTPELFEEYINKAVNQVRNRTEDKQIIFLKSWNEWAEGNYLEPDAEYGTAYLDVIKEVLRNQVV